MIRRGLILLAGLLLGSGSALAQSGQPFAGSCLTLGTTQICGSGTSIAGMTAVGLTSAGTLSWNSDVILQRDGAANILAQRNANSGQILRVGYNWTDASNYSWGMIDAGQTTANTLGIGSRSTGSPAQKLTKLGIFVDGTSKANFGVTTAGVWSFIDEIDSIGSAAGSGPGFTAIKFGGTKPGVGIYLDGGDVGTLAFGTGSGNPDTLMYRGNGANIWALGGTSASFPAIKRSTTTLQVRLADDSADTMIQASTATLTNVATDAAHTDATVCRDTTSGLLLSGTGAVGICLGTSSMRFKHDIAPAIDGLAAVMALKPVTYRYNAGHVDGGKTVKYGFLAEDIVEVLPKLVGFDLIGRPNSVDMIGVVPILAKAIQELKSEVDQLRATQRGRI